jgi:hypothetical protein
MSEQDDILQIQRVYKIPYPVDMRLISMKLNTTWFIGFPKSDKVRTDCSHSCSSYFRDDMTINIGPGRHSVEEKDRF